MELNGLKSDDYIYLRLNKDIKNDNFSEKEGTVISFARDYLEALTYSSIFYEDIKDDLEITRKEDLKDTDILATQVNESMVFKEDTVVSINLFPNRSYVFNEWFVDHLKNEATTYDYNTGRQLHITDYNMQNISSHTTKTLSPEAKYPVITTNDSTLNLKLTFKKGEKLDFSNPGVMSLLCDRDSIELLSSSSVLLGEEKDKYFEDEYKNTFFADENFHRYSQALYRYYRINADLKIDTFLKLGTYKPDIIKKDDDGSIRIICLQGDVFYNQFELEDIKALNKIATEIPLNEAKAIHEEFLRNQKESYEKDMRENQERKERHDKQLAEAYETKKDDPSIFPGANGEFVHTFKNSLNQEEKYTLSEIKSFYEKLKELNKNVLDYMYFYGGTIPYMLTDANTSREFGDVDIFVPIEAMRYVREELNQQPSFEIVFDSINVTSRVNLTSHLPGKEDNQGLDILFALMNPDVDDKTLNEMFNKSSNRCLQDFGLKGKLFGVNISIFPIYQYQKDLMAKSFNITDMYGYLLAVRVMNNMEIKDFAKNVNICGNNLNILPIEYVIISKESAIKEGYQKRVKKDEEDLEYIEEHRQELGIDEKLENRLKENYPNYSISKAYFVGSQSVETISGEKYKELMLLNKGKWLS